MTAPLSVPKPKGDLRNEGFIVLGSCLYPSEKGLSGKMAWRHESGRSRGQEAHWPSLIHPPTYPSQSLSTQHSTLILANCQCLEY